MASESVAVHAPSATRVEQQQNVADVTDVTPAPADAGTPSPGTPEPMMEEAALHQAIRKQVEYYFSRQNLSTDAYLVSQMNHDNYVPIATIVRFKMLSYLTTDPELIARVMSESPEVEVDMDTMAIRPVFKIHERNTIILRDLPADVTPEVRSCLLFLSCPLSCVRACCAGCVD